ncbi:MAG: hypothetical protein V4444_01250 [Pseudomonadota bacterium]
MTIRTTDIEHDLRIALALKSDDIYFALGGSEGRRLRAEYLGVGVFDGLASDVFSEGNELLHIDLGRFEIAGHIRVLNEMISTGSLGLSERSGIPGHDIVRQDALDFVGHFLSSIPAVALGGLDSTSVRNGCLRRFYDRCSAWADLLEAIEEIFAEDPDLYRLRVSDLALLSGVELRSMRNRVGPDKPIRTSGIRSHRENALGEASFVGVNTLDALDWLTARRDFHIDKLSESWVLQRMEAATKRETLGRAAIVTALINFGPRTAIAHRLNWNEQKVNQWAEHGPTDNADDARDLATLVGIDPENYAALCANI